MAFSDAFIYLVWCFWRDHLLWWSNKTSARISYTGVTHWMVHKSCWLDLKLPEMAYLNEKLYKMDFWEVSISLIQFYWSSYSSLLISTWSLGSAKWGYKSLRAHKRLQHEPNYGRNHFLRTAVPTKFFSSICIFCMTTFSHNWPHFCYN